MKSDPFIVFKVMLFCIAVLCVMLLIAVGVQFNRSFHEVAKESHSAVPTTRERLLPFLPINCPKEIDHIVLNVAVKEFHNENDDESLPVWQHKRARIASLRKWVDTLSDPCVRASYTEWLDFYDSQYEYRIKSYRADADVKSDIDRIAQEERVKTAMDRLYLKEHPVPTPPEPTN